MRHALLRGESRTFYHILSWHKHANTCMSVKDQTIKFSYLRVSLVLLATESFQYSSQ